jgi:ATP-dependent helicase/nuclease subunit B
MRLAFPGLMAALAEGATIVLPTSTLASVAVAQFNQHQLSQGNQSWQRPQIQSQDAWLTTCWQQARFASPNLPSLLSPSQERELWRQVIEADRPDLFDIGAMASMAQRAARILAEYQIPTEGSEWREHQDAARFLRWQHEIQRQLKTNNWITRAGLWRHLPGFIAKGEVRTDPVAFAALHFISPALKTLGRAMGDSGKMFGNAFSLTPAPAPVRAFDDLAHETEHAARAIRLLIDDRPASSIGILLADPAKHLPDLIRTLEAVFYPTPKADRGDIHAPGTMLLSHPVVANALLLLELAQPRIHHADAGAIFRSPFIESAAEERSVRALADASLHRAREIDFTLTDLQRACRNCPKLHQILRQIETLILKFRPAMRLPDWSAAFSDILEKAKWPAIANISESEQRSIDQWQRALSELASLGLVAPPVSLHQALAHVRSLLSRPVDIGDWSSPIQIFDAAASEGIQFDHTFILNACDDAWPTRVPLSPLIPYNLQRLHNVPYATAESTNEERARQTEWLFQSARNINVSHTGTLSPLFRPHVQVASDPPPLWSGLTAAQSYPPAQLHSQDDSHAPPLVQSGDLRGGSSIIKAQSLCPFKAFAEYRLNARSDNDACFGFDALDRGNFVHKALELVWKELKTQANLKALSEDELQTLIAECIAQAVFDDGSGPIRSLTTDAERQRLTNVILDWLNVERSRPQPFTVEYLEEKREVDIAGLKLSLRVDRIDRLRNGSIVLIDYKSGAQTKEKLKGDRPKEPQLLVYAAAINEPVEGLFFAEVKNRGARAVGHGVGKHFQNQVAAMDQKGKWDDFLDKAAASVQNLATEFKEGEAAVNPQNSACEYCDIKPICRIKSAGVAEEDEE